MKYNRLTKSVLKSASRFWLRLEKRRKKKLQIYDYRSIFFNTFFHSICTAFFFFNFIKASKFKIVLKNTFFSKYHKNALFFTKMIEWPYECSTDNNKNKPSCSFSFSSSLLSVIFFSWFLCITHFTWKIQILLYKIKTDARSTKRVTERCWETRDLSI